MESAGFVCHACGQRYDQGGYCAHDGQPLVMTDDPLLGTEVGRYRLARLLGEGGMGRVYLAIQPAIGSRVAVKILSDQCARNPELLERFFAEARAVNLIRHERIVSVIDLAQLADGRPFIIMEYVEGQTLAAIAAAGPVPLGGIVQVMAEVLSALAAAHAIGIVHRDLKPDNILVTAEGHAKVLDFGIAKLAPELQQRLSPRTRTGALLGTPQYMAPEQISGSGGVDARTDLYAAGVVIYELATGRPPFVGETLFDLMRAHLEQPPRPPRALRPELPAALEQVILTALAKAPDARFGSALAMAEALQHAGQALPATAWRSLSLRARAGAPGPATGSQAARATRPVGAAPTVDGNGRVGLVIGGVVIAALAVATTLFVVTHDRPAQVAQTASGSATTPVNEANPANPAGRVGDSSARVGDSKLPVGDSKLPVGDSKLPSDPNARVGDSNARVGDSKVPVGDSNARVGDSKVPVGDPRAPISDPRARISDPREPVSDPRAPIRDPNQPVSDLKQPVREPNQPVSDPNQPVSDPKQPIGDPKQPIGDPKRAVVDVSPAVAAAPTAGELTAHGKPTPVSRAAGASPQPSGAPSAGGKPGPTVVNDGSAADHGVIVGPNVTVGSNVIVGGKPPAAPPTVPTGRDELVRPADYDPRHFDPVAYLPKAQQLARELVPDARLTTFEFDPVFPDGHVDLTMAGRDRGYEFRSPERSVFPAGRPRNMPIDRKCRVMIELGVLTISARVASSDSCDARLVRAPRCSFATVWKQARAKGVPADIVARIGWLFDETWFFDTDLAGKGGGVSSFADHCP